MHIFLLEVSPNDLYTADSGCCISYFNCLPHKPFLIVRLYSFPFNLSFFHIASLMFIPNISLSHPHFSFFFFMISFRGPAWNPLVFKGAFSKTFLTEPSITRSLITFQLVSISSGFRPFNYLLLSHWFKEFGDTLLFSCFFN